MPRWNLYLLKGTLSREEKDKLATEVTKLYTDIGAPAFWVNVFFNEYEQGGFYSGGDADHKAVFFHIDHAAKGFESENERLEFIAKVSEIVRPIFENKVFKWEFNIYEHPADNWRINGLVPPVHHPELLKKWFDRNEPVPH